jgi:hypothetical protein
LRNFPKNVLDWKLEEKEWGLVGYKTVSTMDKCIISTLQSTLDMASAYF